MSEHERKPRVVVIGGGYAGTYSAKALDAACDVTLIEPRALFVHNVGLLRALVDPTFLGEIVFSYDRLLTSGRVLQGRVTRLVEGAVELATGGALEADYIVVATGSEYPFPAKADSDDAGGFFDRLGEAHEALAGSGSVLLLGAGPVGIELAGEIKAAWPDKAVTLIDPAAEVLGGGAPARLRAAIVAQLEALGVGLVLGDSIAGEMPVPPARHGAFSALTGSGRRIEAEIWFKCYGGRPRVDYLDPGLAHLETPGGHLKVGASLQLAGCDRMFAVGDVTDIPETKRAGVARFHAEVVARNIADIEAGRVPGAIYTPAPERLVIPIGPKAGAGFDGAGAGAGRFMDVDEVIADKGTDLKTTGMARLFGPPVKHPGGS